MMIQSGSRIDPRFERGWVALKTINVLDTADSYTNSSVFTILMQSSFPYSIPWIHAGPETLALCAPSHACNHHPRGHQLHPIRHNLQLSGYLPKPTLRVLLKLFRVRLASKQLPA